jgi:hypothetical protein
MNITYNLALAEMAVKAVGGIMTHGASNKPIDIVHSTMYRGGVLTDQSTGEQRTSVSRTHGTEFVSEAEFNRHQAARARQTGIGNCAEQATLAFEYLTTRARDGVAVLGMGGDHVCVLIGVPDAGTYPAPSSHDEPLTSVPAWPASAVICDPWYHEWFSVHRDWSRKVRDILRMTWPSDAVKETVRIDVIDRA